MKLTRFVATASICILSAGCYTLQPAAGLAPEVGTSVAFDVNDAGRLALGGSMGPEIAQVEGRLLSREANNGDYHLAVSALHFLRGGEQVWKGEPVTIKSEYVSNVYFRRYSRGRTIALSTIAIVSVAALAGASILGSGAFDPATGPKDTSATRRIPRPRTIPPRSMYHPFPPTTP